MSNSYDPDRPLNPTSEQWVVCKACYGTGIDRHTDRLGNEWDCLSCLGEGGFPRALSNQFDEYGRNLD